MLKMINSRTLRIIEARETLVARYPLTFMPKREPKKPLKIGIYEDLIADNSHLSKIDLKRALFDYCGGLRYLENLVEGSPRFDLAGNETGTVTERQASVALVQIENLRKRWSHARKKNPDRDATAGANRERTTVQPIWN
jgi:sRNA-binding protein